MFRDRFLGGVSHFAMLAADGVDGGGAVDDVKTVDQGTDQGGGQVDQGSGDSDDGFTPEERAQFAEMSRPAPAGDAPAGDADPDAAAAAAAAADKIAGDDGADDGDDDGADGQAAGADDAARKRPRRVNIKTHERELAARDARIKELEGSLSENQIMQAKLDERLKIINEALTPKEQQQREEEDPEPDPEADIFEHNKWLKRQMVKTQAELKELRGGVQQRETDQEIDRWYVSDYQNFARTNPDFMTAYQFMLASRGRELGFQRFGKDFAEVQATPQESAAIRQALEREEKQLVKIASDGGGSAAKLIYGMALARGYTKAAAKAADAGADGNGADKGGAVAEVKPNGNGKTDVREEIRRVKAGVDSSLSLSQGGGAPAMVLDMKKIADMPQEEFDALANTLSDDDWKRIAGGR